MTNRNFYVESVKIHGFWGEYNVALQFYDDLNFIIGRNGSGKTTIINLIAAALRGDIATLYSISFDKIEIALRARKKTTKPVIEVSRPVDEDMGSVNIRYSIRTKAGSDENVIMFGGPYEQRFFRDAKYYNAARRSRIPRKALENLESVLGSLVEVNWLSVHRAGFQSDHDEFHENPTRTGIDAKITTAIRGFASYFSLLSSQRDVETKRFQKEIISNLLENNAFEALKLLNTIDRQVENKLVVGALKDLGFSDEEANLTIEQLGRDISNIKERVRSNRDIGKLSVEDFAAIAKVDRIASIVEKWRIFEKKRSLIFEPKTVFEEIINNLLAGKKVDFDERNIPQISLDSGGKLSVSDLSSGEKQLFILLSEALLQENRPVVFISDEPELSLHVSWQNVLFKNIRRLNSSCQIITATHSPDIVGPFTNRIIKIEDCVRHAH